MKDEFTPDFDRSFGRLEIGAILPIFSQYENVLAYNEYRFFERERRVLHRDRQKGLGAGPAPGVEMDIEFPPAPGVLASLEFDLRFAVILVGELRVDMSQVFLIALPAGALAPVRVIDKSMIEGALGPASIEGEPALCPRDSIASGRSSCLNASSWQPTFALSRRDTR